MRELTKVTLGLLAMFWASSAQAIVVGSLSSTSWKTPGDDLLVFDSATGLYWLRLTETVGTTRSEMLAEMMVGGEYEGFRYATTAELNDLALHAGGVNLSGTPLPENVPAVTGLLELFGTLDSSVSSSNAGGITSESFGSNYRRVFFNILHFMEPDSSQISVFSASAIDPEVPSQYWGHFIVSTVPEPSAALLLAGAAAWPMVSRRRRRK